MRATASVRACALLGAVLAIAGSGCASMSQAASPRAATPSGDWTRFDYNAQRSGVGPSDTGITSSDLSHLQARVVHLDGTVDSSPVELHAISVRGRVRDVVVVTTTYGRTIALDPATGTRLWEFVPHDIGTYEGSAQITTTTPVIDPDRRYLYAASPDGRIHKLAVASGREVRGGKWPVRLTFDPTREKLAAALNLTGRFVVATTGGYVGDAPTYEGHVAVIDTSSGRIVHVWNAECSNRHQLLNPPSSCRADTTFGGSAIWARAGAVVEPTGRLLVATGNGPFDGRTNWGDSVLELTPTASRLLHNWTPTDQQQLNNSDADLGSTAPALLPTYHGLRLAVQGGKDRQLHLLNLGRLDGARGGAGPRLGGEVQDIAAPGGGEVLTQPAVWVRGGQPVVFVANDAGTAAYGLTGGSRPRLKVLWQNATPGTSPVVAGGLLYVFDPAGSLRVYQPGGQQVASLAAAPGHWNSPIVIGGRIIVPTGDANQHLRSGQLFIYHLPGR